MRLYLVDLLRDTIESVRLFSFLGEIEVSEGDEVTMVDSEIVNVEISMANVFGVDKLDCFYHLGDNVLFGDWLVSFGLEF